MIERVIILDAVDPVAFYGVNNANVQLIKNLFPKVRIAARGNVMKVIGDEKETEVFEEKIKLLEKHCAEYNQLSEEVIIDIIKGDEPQFVKDYFDYYKTDRGFHARAINSNGAWSPTMSLSFINMPLLSYIHEIDNAVLFIHGENAHSRYFSEDAFKRLTGDNKELLIIPGANHTDLYDRKIPFDKLETFFKSNLK